jgi:Skp family chaperone for outer membrane proteins
MDPQQPTRTLSDIIGQYQRAWEEQERALEEKKRREKRLARLQRDLQAADSAVKNGAHVSEKPRNPDE